MSFEEFTQKLDHSTPWLLKPESRSTLLLDKYGDILSAIDEVDAENTRNAAAGFGKVRDLIKESLSVNDSGNPLFDRTLEALDVESGHVDLVARTVAKLVLSTTDKWDLERIENKLATYNGPLSVLNAHLNHYLENPALLEANTAEFDDDESPDIIEKEAEVGYNDNNDYYSQITPVDELVDHLNNPDVQFAINQLMSREDEKELFDLLDSIVTPVFKEDMNTLNKIAAIFAKYDEDVHLEFRSRPRLPRIRRLDIFKQLLPEPEDHEGQTEEETAAEIATQVEKIKEEREIIRAEKEARREKWPNLMTRDPLLDSREVLELPPSEESPFHNRVVIRNHHSIFTEALEADGFDFDDPDYQPTRTEDIEEITDTSLNIPISQDQVQKLLRIPVMIRWATKQTGKGKIKRITKVTILGNRNGMVGIGIGKHAESDKADAKSISDAVRNMDWVERFEKRTIWTEVRTKFGATVLILRPRPVGFGLRCNPILHPLLKAAGIKDISAKVWGSRNPLQVLKAALRLLHAGNAPLGMGDGLGGPGRKMHKGVGLRNKSQIERERGRRLIDLKV
ncbi:37S ribosomal protein S5 [Mycena rebaudengoi]|nr:37S ribosomal protein S5 [Mycena rebaudengoi]